MIDTSFHTIYFFRVCGREMNQIEKSDDMRVGFFSLREVETAEAPPVAEQARLFRGSARLPRPKGSGKRLAQR
jgi:hypothetical protein